MNSAAADPDTEVLREALEAEQPPAALALTVERFVRSLDLLRPEVFARFAALGLDRATAEETLADVPRKVAAYGTGPEVGIDVGWLLGLARADVVSVGRLQVERVAGPDGRAVHVPESGALLPAAVDASLERAVALFGGEPFTCTSWLLDPLLPAALGPGSGIVRFASRFVVDPTADRSGTPGGSDGEDGDRAVAKFVFRRPLREVLDPRITQPRTRLEHCVVGHLRAGGHWSEPRGVHRRTEPHPVRSPAPS